MTKDLHDAIMNILCKVAPSAPIWGNYLHAYQNGHRDARHAAAELAMAAPEQQPAILFYDFTDLEGVLQKTYRWLITPDSLPTGTKLYAAPQAQPAIKDAAELTDADMVSIAYDCNALPEVITDETLLKFGRALLAAQKARVG